MEVEGQRALHRDKAVSESRERRKGGDEPNSARAWLRFEAKAAAAGWGECSWLGCLGLSKGVA